MADFDVLGQVALDDTATAGLRRVGSEIDSLGPIGDHVGRILDFAFGQVVYNAVSSVIGKIAELGQEILGIAANEQVMLAAYQNLTGAGEDLMGVVDDMALKTPFPKDMLEDAVRINLAMGATREEAVNTAQAWSNLALRSGALGADIKQLSFVWQMMEETGTVSTRVLRQFGMQGIQIGPVLLGVASKIMGKDVPSIKALNDLIKKGRISFADLTKGVTDYGLALTDGSDAVDRMSNTLPGLRTRFANVLQVIGEGFGVRVLDKFMPLLGGVFDAIERFVESGRLEVLTDQFIKWLEPLIKFLDPIVQAFERFFYSLAWGKDPVQAIKDLMKDILPKWVVDLWDRIAGIWDAVKPSLDNVRNAIMDLAADAVREGVRLLGEAIEKGLGWLEDHEKEISAALDAVANFVRDHGVAVIAFFGMLAGVKGLEIIASGLWSIAGGLAAMVTPVTVIAGLLAVGIGTGMDRMRESMGDAAWSKLGMFEQIKLGFQRMLTDAAIAFMELGTLAWLGVQRGVEAWWNMPGQIVTIIQGAAGVIAAAIDTWAAGVLVEMDKLVSDAVEAVQGRIGEFRTIGSAIINGMVAGVKAAAGALVAAAIGVVKDAIEAAKKLLGIKSPSTVFAGIGGQMMAGLTLGLDRGSMDALGTWSAIASKMAATGRSTTYDSSNRSILQGGSISVPDTLTAQALVNLLRPLASV